ncbi:hypothetical protein HMSSN036_12150 [Paenibacillus macerans]|nr:hypothetical protein HMSSN036_12150 [Paenibacillus macerans]
MNRMVPGRHIYALGGNEKAATLSGVKTKKVTFWVFVNMGALAALSGLIFAARLNSATPKAGTNLSWTPSRPALSAAPPLPAASVP